MSEQRGIKILLVDDEPHILEFLELGLQQEGYQVITADNGTAGLAKAEEFAPHVVILDIMMPGMDGYEVCRRLKASSETAVIMLSAKEEVEDRIKGLTTGADDYLVKPFSFGELLARIHARLRNQFPLLLSEVHKGRFQINDQRREILMDGKPLELSPTEYELLKLLLMNEHMVLSKGVIMQKVWGYDFGGEDNIVEVYVRSLREKIGDRNHTIIRTVRGAGYRMDVS